VSSPGEPPIHPDEVYPIVYGSTLYGNPGAMHFSWGGAFYFRIGFLAQHLVAALPTSTGAHGPATSILLLRGLSVVLGLLTALLVARIGLRMYGRSVALVAAALLLCFPAHVLECHYARPGAPLTFLVTAALATACGFVRSGRWSLLFSASVLTGLAGAIQLWGFFALAATTVAAAERGWGISPAERGRFGLVAAVGIAAGTLVGYVAGSFESLLFPDAFLAGLARGNRMAASPGLHLPVAYATTISAYAFGSIAALASWCGLLLLVKKRRPGSLALVAYVVAGWSALGRIESEMMRYLLALSPVVALAAALALVELGRALSIRPAVRVGVSLLAVVFTFQLSLAYVLPMQIAEDPRYIAGRWLVERVPQGSRVGVTRSFSGDNTYGPRLQPGHGLRMVPLSLRGKVDSARLLGLAPDYIATSDYAIEHTSRPGGSKFFRALTTGDRYELVASFGPPWQPVCIPDWLGSRRPPDLLYVRSAFHVYARRR
jgi:MFS family permease